MFRVGQAYDFEILDTADDEGRPAITTFPSRSVLAVDGPLVKIREYPDGEVVINTHSSVFVRATLKKQAVSTGKYAPGKPPKSAK